MSEENSKSRSRFTLIMLFVVFIAPLAGGYGWYLFGDNFRAKNYGELFSPARAAAETGLNSLEGEKTSIQALTGKWTIMYIGPSKCLEPCLTQLDKVTKMRHMQGKRIRRIQNVFIADGDLADIDEARILEVLKPGAIFGIPADSRNAIVQLFTREGESADQLHRIYLLDPIGNIVLSYPADADLNKVKKDLSRLLRVSQIG